MREWENDAPRTFFGARGGGGEQDIERRISTG